MKITKRSLKRLIMIKSCLLTRIDLHSDAIEYYQSIIIEIQWLLARLKNFKRI